MCRLVRVLVESLALLAVAYDDYVMKKTEEISDLSEIKKKYIAMKEQRFADLSDIQRKVKTLLLDIPENDFQDCFRQWHHRLTKCIASQREYFEVDSRI